jgi:hypothetical protein
MGEVSGVKGGVSGKALYGGHANAVGVCNLFVWLVADGWCWFILREKYCWLVAGGWFVVREKYCWLVADKPSEQAGDSEQRAVRPRFLPPTPRGSPVFHGPPAQPASQMHLGNTKSQI